MTVPEPPALPPGEPIEARLRRGLGARSIVLVGLMGAGKSTVGRRLASRLGLMFKDADHEIEAAAKLTIADIFAIYGEASFREGEERVIARLLREGPMVLATGGGAFMREATRARIAEGGISVWLKADLEVLMRRVRKRATRPLLQTEDPEATMRALMEVRHPVYAGADLTVLSRDVSHDRVMQDVMEALDLHVNPSAPRSSPAMSQPLRVSVPLNQGRDYDIRIGRGLLDEIGIEARDLGARAAGIVTDETVAGLYGERVKASLEAAGLRCGLISVPPGEASKSFSEFARVCDGLLAQKIERGDLVVALGGGVVGDLAGFAAASLRRGVRFIQAPTTLLAQVDSSVGGKTGINSPLGKNLIGAFHQPRLVLADTATLDTLSEREMRAGYAEVAKYGLIGDADFFEWCEANWSGIFSGGPERDEAVAACCRAKAGVVVRDEREDGERALLNLGHTFGHALERLTAYDSARLVHGEGVAIGLALAFRFSARLGLCPGQDAGRVANHLALAGLPTRLQQVPGGAGDAHALLDAMAQDKKVRDGRLTFILARSIGQSFIAPDIDGGEVRAFLEDELRG
ncbi:shikimate kinase/3-dehydroquinate synthase [Methylorubrum rhodinum]|uniref:Multifunctional fusion protein n=1 Tax=Methylorubrum rhodinum TaxID=29428 RepID=A0A840ZG15_9HYPH|nr:3-dehydroquinate synthase [Methylorubrum rhodinum]MBB5755823.1 shikimate kinase/3-dehydroquinate synthase [Methylorubrum rhodinum]